MLNPFDYPVPVFVVSLVVFWSAAWAGARFGKNQKGETKDGHDDLTFILGAALTLLGLIIGFAFSMAVSRYDQRRNYEEEEANAIGTEYVRANLLPAGTAEKVRGLLRVYLNQRILEYSEQDAQQLRQINAETTRLQDEMWSAVAAPATAQPTAVAGLVLAGMNDVLDSQGRTQAAWWNRIPIAAWLLVIMISVFCNVLIGYRAPDRRSLYFLILPIALSISLFLIADIDSPRHGIIRVPAQNLTSLVETMRP